MTDKPTIGFIGQGFIGKSYADDFEKRGYSVVRYGLQPEYVNNKERIAECDVVFIAVNAGTIPAGTLRDDGHPAVQYDDRNVRETPSLARPGAIVVIKSTLPPGTTESIQAKYPDRIILHSPEFLLETTAAKDASSPERNIVGMPSDDEAHRTAAELVLSLLPKAPYELVTLAKNAELIKYGSNAFLFTKIVFSNMFYQLAEKHGADWEVIREAIGKDPRIGPSHMDLHLKDDPAGVMHRRGAGRSCFIKDWAELSELYAASFPEDKSTIQALRGFEYKNAELLREFDRYVNLLEGVYGREPERNSMDHYDFAIDLVRRAGEQLKAASQDIIVSHKGTDVRDIVTDTDLKINAFLISEIHTAFPEHRIFSEEGTDDEQMSEYAWMIDPIDGSANFSRGIPHFAICVGLLKNGVPIVGAVFNPITNELFSFSEGKGAFLNGNPMQVSGVTEPSKAQGILIVGHKEPLFDWGTSVYRSFLEHLSKLKGLGSSSLDLCFLAAGRADIVVYGTLTTQDIASAIGIVRAAGGEVYTTEGIPVEFSATRQTVVATANKELFESIRPFLHTDLLPR